MGKEFINVRPNDTVYVCVKTKTEYEHKLAPGFGFPAVPNYTLYDIKECRVESIDFDTDTKDANDKCYHGIVKYSYARTVKHAKARYSSCGDKDSAFIYEINDDSEETREYNASGTMYTSYEKVTDYVKSRYARDLEIAERNLRWYETQKNMLVEKIKELDNEKA